MSYEIVTIVIFFIFFLLFLISHKVINEIFVLFLVLWPVTMFFTGEPMNSLIPHIFAGLGFFIVGLILFARNLTGGGTAKGIALIGLWPPIPYLLPMGIVVR